MGFPSNSDSVAQDQIRAFVERILRMKEEAKAIKDDIREIYAEAKGNGFDKTVLGQVVSYVEKRQKDNASLIEREALFELYLAALDGTTAHAGARDSANSVPDHFSDPRNMVESTTQNTSNSGGDSAKLTVAVTTPKPAYSAPAGAAADVRGGENAPVLHVDTNQPETANKSLGDGDAVIGTGNAVVDAANGAVLLPTPQGAADGTPHRSGVTGGESAATTNVSPLRPVKPAQFVQVPFEGAINQ